MTVRNEEQLVEDAIGDTVDSTILFNNEISVVDSSDDSRFGSVIWKILPNFFTKKAEERTKKILNNPISNYISDDEQPHFILKCGSDIRREKENETSTLAPSPEFESARIVITNSRIIFLLGQTETDVVKSIYYSEIDTIDTDSSLRRTSIFVKSEDLSYEVKDCRPDEEVKPAVAYVRAQSEAGQYESDWTKENFTYEKGNSASDRFSDLLGDLDLFEIGKAGINGAMLGKKIGAKGSAIGFTLKGGYEIWRQISSREPSSTETPNPEQVAKSVKKWQQAGATTKDEKTEWLFASVGAAISIAAENTDQETSRLLDEVDPELVADSVIKGSELIGHSTTDLLPSSVKMEDLPEINNLRLPVGEITAIVAELIDDGIFDDVIDDDVTSGN